MNKYKNFEEFLESKFDDSGATDGVLDDDLPDALDDWMSEIDTQDLMNYAEEWGELRFLEGKEVGAYEQSKVS